MIDILKFLFFLIIPLLRFFHAFITFYVLVCYFFNLRILDSEGLKVQELAQIFHIRQKSVNSVEFLWRSSSNVTRLTRVDSVDFFWRHPSDSRREWGFSWRHPSDSHREWGLLLTSLALLVFLEVCLLSKISVCLNWSGQILDTLTRKYLEDVCSGSLLLHSRRFQHQSEHDCFEPAC